MKDVIIKVYVESSTFCSPKKTQAIKRSSPIRLPSKPPIPNKGKQGYDRRAQLLAYARKLRCPDGKPAKWPAGKSMPRENLKWRWPLSFNQLRLACPRLFHRTNKRCWRYEHIATEDYRNDVEELCKQQKTKTTKRS